MASAFMYRRLVSDLSQYQTHLTQYASFYGFCYHLM